MSKWRWGVGALVGACALGGAGCEGDPDPSGSSSTSGSGAPPTTVVADEECTDAQLRSCVAGGCMVTAPPGTLAPGQKLTVAERTVPAELANDAIGPRMCELTFPTGSTAKVTLSITTAGGAE